jgi:transposase-like protein
MTRIVRDGHARGETCAETARRYGVSTSTIRKWRGILGIRVKGKLSTPAEGLVGQVTSFCDVLQPALTYRSEEVEAFNEDERAAVAYALRSARTIVSRLIRKMEEKEHVS